MKDIFQKLCSKSTRLIVEALYELQSKNEPVANASIVLKVIELMQHTDAEIREQAVVVAGLHWHEKAAYPNILRMISSIERDQSVLIALCSALSSMIMHGIGNRAEASILLRKIVRDVQLDPELRGTAYVEILLMYSKISQKDYARSKRDINCMTVDNDFLDSL